MSTATKQSVKAYLIEEYGFSPLEADQLCKLGKNYIERGQRLMSYAYYVANEILDEFVDEDGVIHKGGVRE